MVIAGGKGYGGPRGAKKSRDNNQPKVLLLDGMDSEWRPVETNLAGTKAQQAGVLVGDNLICIGGIQDQVWMG